MQMWTGQKTKRLTSPLPFAAVFPVRSVWPDRAGRYGPVRRQRQTRRPSAADVFYSKHGAMYRGLRKKRWRSCGWRLRGEKNALQSRLLYSASFLCPKERRGSGACGAGLLCAVSGKSRVRILFVLVGPCVDAADNKICGNNAENGQQDRSVSGHEGTSFAVRFPFGSAYTAGRDPAE